MGDGGVRIPHAYVGPHFYCAMLCIARTMLSQDVCVSIARRYRVVTVKHILKLFSPSGIHTDTSDIPSQRHLRSSTRHHLTVPPYWLITFGRRAFSVAGRTVWNSRPGAQQQQLQRVAENETITTLYSTHRSRFAS